MDSVNRRNTVVADRSDVLKKTGLLFTVQPAAQDAVNRLSDGSVVAGLMYGHSNPGLVKSLNSKKLTGFAMELIPRISRAQSMDVLSSQAAAAGYQSVLIAATTLDKFFPMLTTAAGTIRPAQVLVIGAGVAGLQAIATAKRLGAVVTGYDVRGATKEQVESLGAKFVETGVSAEGEGGYARELTDEEKQQQQAAPLQWLLVSLRVLFRRHASTRRWRILRHPSRSLIHPLRSPA